MSKRFDEALWEKHQLRAVSPWGSYQVGCLDLFTKRFASEPVLARILKHMLSCLSAEAPLLEPSSVMVSQGSMLGLDLMSPDCNWVGDKELRERLQQGLEDLKDPKIPGASEEGFNKTLLPPISLEWKVAGSTSLWLMGIAGVELEYDDVLSCTVDGIQAASVDVEKVLAWVSSQGDDGRYDWCPDLDKLLQRSTDWHKDGDVKRLWIVTDVLTATEFTLSGRKDLFANASITAPTGAPGMDISGKISVRKTREGELVVAAAKRTRFPIATKHIRVDYNVREKKVVSVRPREESDLRGDEDLLKKVLESMHEDMFEDNHGGEPVPIPLLMLTDQELTELI